MQMQWELLKDDKCPKCTTDLFFSVTGFVSCKNPLCDFKSREERVAQIIQDMAQQELAKNDHEKKILSS